MKVVIIGAGGVASSLAPAVKEAGHEILQIYSHTVSSAKTLADSVGCGSTIDIKELRNDADIYLVSIKDAALAEVGKALTKGRENALWVHTAGSMSMNVFGDVRRGVLYPMQTFSRSKKVCFRAVPCFIEASTESDKEILTNFARSLSDSVTPLDEDARKYLHLAAVFCCNFTNHCCAIAEEILLEKGIPFSVMLPLLDETVAKLHTVPPREAQTGPAVRYDKNVLTRQQTLLEDAMAKDIYRLMSENIHRFSSTDNNNSQS